MQYLYPTLIDIALQKGQPDVEKLVDQLHAVTLAYVDDKMQNASPETSASPQTSESNTEQIENMRQQVTFEVYQYFVNAFKDLDGEFNEFLTKQLLVQDEVEDLKNDAQ